MRHLNRRFRVVNTSSGNPRPIADTPVDKGWRASSSIERRNWARTNIEGLRELIADIEREAWKGC